MNRLLTFLASLTITIDLLPVVVALSALKDKNSDHKVILLYDKHDRALDDTIKEQQQELKQLITILSTCKKPSTFFIEYPYRTKNFNTIYNYTTVHVPIHDALTHKMKHGAIEYKPFDKRGEEYFWIRELAINLPAVKAAIKQGTQLPKEYTATTIGSYLQSLQQDEKEAQAILDQLPQDLQKTWSEKIKLYIQTKEFILEQLKKHQLKPQHHFSDFMEKFRTNKDWQTLYNAFFVPIGSVNTDISLLHEIIHDKNTLSVVLGGLYHMHHLEKDLVTAGFEDTLTDVDFKNGIQAEDINNMVIPTQIPVKFMGVLKKFLNVCDACNKEASSKCSLCKNVFYCSKECQKRAWKSHKLYCKKVPEINRPCT